MHSPKNRKDNKFIISVSIPKQKQRLQGYINMKLQEKQHMGIVGKDRDGA